MDPNQSRNHQSGLDQPHPQTVIEIVAQKVEQSEGARGFLTLLAAYAGMQIGLRQLAGRLDQQMSLSAKAQKLVAWMRQRASEGEDRKKILFPKAQRAMQFSFTTREFNACYKLAFGKKRGRPRQRK